MNLAAAQKLATKIHDELAPFCERIAIAGSIRRQRPEVNDVDIVCLPRGAQGLHDVLQRCDRTARQIKCGPQYRVFELRGGFQLDLWLAHPERVDLLGERTPSNWATLLVCRTGSKEFNIMLAGRAREVGLHWDPHAGLMKLRGRAGVPTPTEEDFFKALSLEYVKPEDREA